MKFSYIFDLCYCVEKSIQMKKHKYDPDLIERILADDDYVLHLFVAQYLKTHDKLYLPKLRKNGDYTMKCILHPEKTPSLRYSSRMKMFKCFGCGHGGNILTLIIKYYNLSFLGSIKRALQMKSVPNLILKEGSPKIDKKQFSIVYPLHADDTNDKDDLPF